MHLTTYVESLSAGLITAGRFRRLESYHSAARSIARFSGTPLPKLKIVFTHDFLCRYREHLVRSGYKQNTISSYISALHSIANRAVGEKLLPDTPGLFENIPARPAPGIKRALPASLLKLIFTADLSRKPLLEPCRDYFTLSILLQGISFADLAHLRKKDITDGIISYRRRKTGGLVQIPLSPEIEELFIRYAGQVTDSPYLLPIITLTGEAGYRQYLTARHRQNRQLKELANYLGIKENLTTYSARHSWATIAYHNGVDVGIVSQGMGHQTEKTTRIYLTLFDKSELAQANRIVLNAILHSGSGNGSGSEALHPGLYAGNKIPPTDARNQTLLREKEYPKRERRWEQKTTHKPYTNEVTATPWKTAQKKKKGGKRRRYK